MEYHWRFGCGAIGATLLTTLRAFTDMAALAEPAVRLRPRPQTLWAAGRCGCASFRQAGVQIRRQITFLERPPGR